MKTTMQNRRIWNGVFVTIITLLIYHVTYFAIKFPFENRVLFAVQEKNVAKERSSSSKSSFSSVLCEQIDASSGSSFQHVWENMKPALMKVSLLSTNWTKDIRSNTTFTDWVEESMSYFTYSRLQYTMASPPIDQDRTIGRIHSILEEKLTNPNTAPPLRIVIFGGSVTTGHHCLDNIWNFLIRNDGHGNDRAGSSDTEAKFCAWSGRLQDMLDEVLGHGVVEITNLAVGGSTTDISTAVLEFGLIPGSTPDIIVWDHGTNDALYPSLPNEKINSDSIFAKLQQFYQATLALQNSCNNPDPPLVILLDSFIGQQQKLPLITESLSISTAASKMLTWYPDIWGVSYANTIRPYLLSNVNDKQFMLRLLGVNGIITHPGMMYHMSVAWVIAFNVFHALYENCETRSIVETRRPSFQSIGDGETTMDPNQYFKVSYIPKLTDELRMIEVPDLWKERLSAATDGDECGMKKSEKEEAAEQFTAHSSLTCFYAWVVNKVLKIESSREINEVIQPYMAKNKGWMAHSGWIPNWGKGSYFELQFENVPHAVNTMTIIYMKSYSEKWVNSTLQIDCIFVETNQEANMTTSSARDMIANNSRSGSIEEAETLSTIRHSLSGYHDDETSILMPIKLPLPDRSSNGKSTLRLQFTLLDGETFKISGMALC